MLTSNLEAHVEDQIAHNAIPYGKYVLISFHMSENDPIVISKGMNEKRWNIATHSVRSTRQGGKNG